MITHEPQCIQWKRQGAERIAMQIANMSREQELEFWQQKTEQLREVLRKVRELSVNLKVVNNESLPDGR